MSEIIITTTDVELATILIQIGTELRRAEAKHPNWPTDPSARPQVANWNSVVDSPPSGGLMVLGFNESWIDEDFNPEGICECYLQEVETPYWVISKYCNYHEEWHTRYSHEASVELGDDFSDYPCIDAPTNYMYKPKAPTVVGGSKQAIKEELIQTAAMCVRMLKNLEQQPCNNNNN